jgi:prepilin-type N-terminal cleavage/methylation domain-containing protein
MFIKLSRNQAGFTLAEVVIACALIGILALALVNQLQLVGASKKEANESAIINGLTDKLATELSRRETCSLGANFGGRNIAGPAPGTISDADGNPIVTVGATYGVKATTGPVINSSLSAASVGSVQVSSITTSANATNPNEMILKVQFTKMRGIAGLFKTAAKIELPITVIQTGGIIKYCYNDITNSITSAIRLSCRGNTSIFIADTSDPTYAAYFATNPTIPASPVYAPYGVCVHNVSTTACPSGQYMKKIEVAGVTNQLQYTCVGFQAACPAGQFITGYAANGKVTCNYPLPNCNPGEMMVMSAGGNYTCLKTNVAFSGGCSGLYAIKRFNADGSVTCAQFYPPRTCAGLVTSISPGSTTCTANVKAVTCPVGQYVSSVDASGQPVCSQFINYPRSCAGGYGVSGVNSSGNITCQLLDRKTSCGGAISASNTFLGCQGAGGTVMNRDGGTNSYCKFNTASCPGGWAQCLNWRYTTNTSCTDTNSACSYSVQTRYVSGSNVFSNPVTPATATCYYWARNSGPWVYSCSQLAGPTSVTPTIQSGCY